MNKMQGMCFFILGILSCLMFFTIGSLLLRDGVKERAIEMDEAVIVDVGSEFHFKNYKYEYILHGELPKNISKAELKKSDGYIQKGNKK